MTDAKGDDIRRALTEAARQKILVLDGAMGTMIQQHRFTEEQFRGERFAHWPSDLRGNNDLLVLTQPDAIEAIHYAYAIAGADLVATNTFNSTSISQADYGMESLVPELNREAARLCRAACDRAEREDGRRRFVVGSLGPTNRTASISPDVNNPGFRAVSFDQLHDAYAEATRALIEGGADIIIIETIFDTLNAKAAYAGVETVFSEHGVTLPIMVSGTITDLSGRTLSGQTPTAFWYSVAHARPFTIGLNCALGAREMRAHLAEIGARRRYVGLRLPQCRPAQRIRPLRREPRLHGRTRQASSPRVRPGQRRRRLLRHDTPDHIRRHRRSASRGIAPRAGCRAIAPTPAAVRAGTLRADGRISASSTSASAPTSPAPPVSASSIKRGRLSRLRSTSPAIRWRAAPRSSTSTWTRACSTRRRRWSTS